jgi:RNA polymerase sigma-70 factor (ECF subfamily)
MNSGTVTPEETVTDCFQIFRRPVFLYVAGILRDHAEAEDVTQEAFLRLFGQLLSGDEIHNLRSWLFQVSHNLAIEHRRRAGVIQQLGSEWGGDVAASGPDIEQILTIRSRSRNLQMAMCRLSGQERRAFQLRAEGYRYREIACKLNIGISSVENYIGRAIRKIQMELQHGAHA